MSDNDNAPRYHAASYQAGYAEAQDRIATLEGQLEAYRKTAPTPEVAALHAERLREVTEAYDSLEKESDALEAQVAALVRVMPWLIEKARTANGHDASRGPTVDCAQCGAIAEAEAALVSTADAARAYTERIRAEEREACAKVAEEYWRDRHPIRIKGADIAAAIRARGKDGGT